MVGATKQALMDCYETNAVGPLILTQGLLPLLAASSLKKVLVVSSMMGSLELTTEGGSISYRASKAGANMVTKCMAGELNASHGLVCCMVHPGWVATEMGSAGNRAPPVQPAESVKGMLALIDMMEPGINGTFWDWNCKPLPW